MQETKKILDKNIEVIATCVRVPVFIGHSEALFVEFEDAVTPEVARALLKKAPGIEVYDEKRDGGYITPQEAKGQDVTFISRIRKDPTVPNGLAMWVVSDNLRKGAALNAVQIAEELVKRKLITPKSKSAKAA